MYDKKEKENCKMWLLFNMHFLPQCLFFFFFFFFENQTCGQRKDKEKEVLTIKDGELVYYERDYGIGIFPIVENLQESLGEEKRERERERTNFQSQ